jgi:hypothetical protein
MPRAARDSGFGAGSIASTSSASMLARLLVLRDDRAELGERREDRERVEEQRVELAEVMFRLNEARA